MAIPTTDPNLAAGSGDDPNTPKDPTVVNLSDTTAAQPVVTPEPMAEKPADSETADTDAFSSMGAQPVTAPVEKEVDPNIALKNGNTLEGTDVNSPIAGEENPVVIDEPMIEDKTLEPEAVPEATNLPEINELPEIDKTMQTDTMAEGTTPSMATTPEVAPAMLNTEMDTDEAHKVPSNNELVDLPAPEETALDESPSQEKKESSGGGMIQILLLFLTIAILVAAGVLVYLLLK